MKVIGLMSGTSVDGIDVALVEITGTKLDLQVNLLAGTTIDYPLGLRTEILEVCGGKALSVEKLTQLDDAIANQFALAAQDIQNNSSKAELIGSHGQTVYHQPPISAIAKQENQHKIHIGYSVQLGRGAVIANATGLPTVSNFRAADIAAGGQGAPLVPKVDAYLLSHPHKYRAVQNLGGIGNVTLIPPNNKLEWEQEVSGWDTGPGNVLLDLAVQQLTNGSKAYDHNGQWAAQGTPNFKLVDQWLENNFFQQAPPKSTGRELFGPAYLAECWQDAQQEELSQADWLATLSELTVASIIHSYQNFCPQMPEEILLCGGGSRNLYLRQRLQAELTSTRIFTTDEVGLDGDYKEAIAFAILAYWRFHCSIPGNLTQVTGAKKPMLLGEIHLPL
ncbi:molecular chaperone [Xenococcus sp. PCC 7305]|uniref:anhydro-N-acetylmuramic acid kinase n=1 Tax=Xenococcus sp. PCC 7305 TaxID=102125 RepID=UPI0002AD181E|nr:anhydro-N-acetylmuramic acid kinase [Xenococcus sp. PCC 7305]ELS00567.1 molecular chaperone [Xenococcus sp. PCC 7305]